MRLVFWILIGLVVSLLAYIFFDKMQDRRLEPYTGVEVVEAVLRPGGVHFRANFTKNPRGKLGECDLVRFAVYGVDLNFYKLVGFTDLDGRPPDDSREAGEHTVDIVIDTDRKAYEVYEFRTQHRCPVEAEDGSIVEVSVSRIFARIDLN